MVVLCLAVVLTCKADDVCKCARAHNLNKQLCRVDSTCSNNNNLITPHRRCISFLFGSVCLTFASVERRCRIFNLAAETIKFEGGGLCGGQQFWRRRPLLRSNVSVFWRRRRSNILMYIESGSLLAVAGYRVRRATLTGRSLSRAHTLFGSA